MLFTKVTIHTVSINIHTTYINTTVDLLYKKMIIWLFEIRYVPSSNLIDVLCKSTKFERYKLYGKSGFNHSKTYSTLLLSLFTLFELNY